MPDSVGISRHTGQVVYDFDHVVLCLEALLTTRRLTRVMLRQFGSDSTELIDDAMNEFGLVRYYSAVATAVAIWEPRVNLNGLEFVTANADGQTTLRMNVEYLPRGHKGDRTPADVRTVEFLAIGGAFRAIAT